MRAFMTTLVIGTLILWVATAAAQQPSTDPPPQGQRPQVEPQPAEASPIDGAAQDRRLAPEEFDAAEADRDTRSFADRDRPRDDGRRRDNRWRYRYQNGHWWYWLPSNQWVFWNGSAWLAYAPQAYADFYFSLPLERRTYYRGYDGRYDRRQFWWDGGYYDGRYYRRGYYDPGYGPFGAYGYGPYDLGAARGAGAGAAIGGAMGGQEGAAIGAGIGAAIGADRDGRGDRGRRGR
jgi:hypothetical protein